MSMDECCTSFSFQQDPNLDRPKQVYKLLTLGNSVRGSIGTLLPAKKKRVSLLSIALCPLAHYVRSLGRCGLQLAGRYAPLQVLTFASLPSHGLRQA